MGVNRGIGSDSGIAGPDLIEGSLGLVGGRATAGDLRGHCCRRGDEGESAEDALLGEATLLGERERRDGRGGVTHVSAFL